MSECIAVAMSGGVDSSVTAGLLKEQGYEVIGITLRLWEEEPACKVERNIHACCSLDSVNDAKAVADVLGIRHYTLDFRDVFRHDVIDYFIDMHTARLRILVLPAIGSLNSDCCGIRRNSSERICWQQDIMPELFMTMKERFILCVAVRMKEKTSPMCCIN